MMITIVDLLLIVDISYDSIFKIQYIKDTQPRPIFFYFKFSNFKFPKFYIFLIYSSKETNNQTKVLNSLEEKVTQLHKKNKELKAKKQKFPDQEKQISNFE